MKYKTAHKFLLNADVIFDKKDFMDYCEINLVSVTSEEASNILKYFEIKGYIDKNYDYYTKSEKLLKEPQNKQTIYFNTLINNPYYNDKTSLKNAFKSLCLSENKFNDFFDYFEQESDIIFNSLYSLCNDVQRFETFNL